MKRVNISVLITSYNHAHFLSECLDAVFNQSVLPLEVIVIDDASTDQSVDLIHEYQKSHPELILLKNETNQGPAIAMNRAIHHAKGKYIALAASDDQVLPRFFELGASYLDANPEVGICCSNSSMFKNIKPYFFWEFKVSHENHPTFISPIDMKNRILFTSLWIPTNASLYRRDLVLKYGCLDDSLKHLCDWFLNYKIALNHGILYVPHSFGACRLLPQSYGAKWSRSYWRKIEIYQKLFKVLSQEPASFQENFCQAGLLGLISADVLLYLFSHFSLWKYLPRAFYRKTFNLFRKIHRSVKHHQIKF